MLLLLLLVRYQRVRWPLQILPATHGGQRGAGWSLERMILHVPHYVRPVTGVQGALAGASLPPRGPGRSRLVLVEALGLRRGGQGLEEAGDVAEARLGGLLGLGQAVVAPNGSILPDRRPGARTL